MLEILFPNETEDLNQVRYLMNKYASSLGLDLRYQCFEKEIEELPGKYAPPTGYLFLAKYGGAPTGCIALRRIDDSICEMKRLYVRPDYRGEGIGRRLVESLISKAVELGYDAMKLDTREVMKEAISLYKSVGFVETAAYTYNPSEDAVYLELTIHSKEDADHG